MAQGIWIPMSIGRRIDVSAGQKIAVIDVLGGTICSSPAAGGKTKTFSIGTAKGIPTAMTTSTDTWSDAVPSSGR